jgi:hypothetical protein
MGIDTIVSMGCQGFPIDTIVSMPIKNLGPIGSVNQCNWKRREWVEDNDVVHTHEKTHQTASPLLPHSYCNSEKTP